MSLESLNGELLEKIALMGGIDVYRTMIRAIPKLALRDGVSYRAQKHFTVQSWHHHGYTQLTVNGLLHCVDGPAVIYLDGRLEWWLLNKLHRVGGPARTWPDGRKEWWFNDQRHRVGEPAIVYPDGRGDWWLNGKWQDPPLWVSKV